MEKVVVTGSNTFSELTFSPLTGERWVDLETLFGERGACGGCWCMWQRLKRSEFERQKGEANKQALRAIVEAGEVPGLLAYLGNKAVGWCSVAPREQYPVLDRSRILKRIDDVPVWSVACLFVEKSYRHRGLTLKLLQAAIDYVRRQGGRVVEGYPVEPRQAQMPSVFAWTGFASTFARAGFVECARRSETRPIMRFYIEAD